MCTLHVSEWVCVIIFFRAVKAVSHPVFVGILNHGESKCSCLCVSTSYIFLGGYTGEMVIFFLSTSKLTQDNRIESPIPILPLPTPDVETEKLIKMKDEEVSLESYPFIPLPAWS